MNIKPLRIETVFSGGIHLIWLTLLVLYFLNRSPDVIFNFLSKIEPGTSVFLLAVLFSVAFFIGRIAENFLGAINYLKSDDEKRQSLANNFIGEAGVIWGNKSFSLSSLFGLIISTIMLCIQAESENARLAILVVGFILIIATASSFCYWFYFEKRTNK